MDLPADPPVLTFEDGIPGLRDLTRWTIVDLTEGGEYQLLTAIDDADVSLVVASPWLFFPDYAPDIPNVDIEALEIGDPADAVVFCAVNLPDGQDVPTMNLLGPFVVNAHTRLGRQVILDDPSHGVRTPLPDGD